MLYDPDTSLSRDAQSTRDAESVLQREARRLHQTKPHQHLPQKQRLMHFLQEKHFRLPHLVVRYGTQLLKNAAGRLGNAVWDLYERVFVASLDAHDYPVASWCLTTLDRQWPGSTRVARLKGMNSEARGHFSTAQELYAEFLQDEPTNIPLLRRQVACAKGAGDLPGAISLLNAYLRTYSSDESAWLELSDLYVQTCQYDLAAFAVEELIMLAPESYLHHLRYADLQYTLGAYELARQYYAQSLELKPTNNLRALYGLALALKTKSGAATAPQPQELYGWTAAQIVAHYNKWQPRLLEVVKTTLSGEASAVHAGTAGASAAAPAPATVTVTTITTTVTSGVTAAAVEAEPRATELPD